MERVRVQLVAVPMHEEVFQPHLEGWERQEGFDSLDDEHGELQLVTGAKVHRLLLRDALHRLLEVIRSHQGDQVGHLVQPIRGVQRT